ncbi:unnamed protein product [Rhodiola kirilowii]
MTTTTTSPTQKLSSNVLHHFSVRSSSSSSMKLKTIIHSLIFSHICRMARALSKAKSLVANLLKDIDLIDHFKKGTGNKHYYKHHHHKVKVYGSFRLHYNWCSSSHVLPEPEVFETGFDKFTPNQLYYDATWSSVVSTGVESSLGLSEYLHWLEETPDHVKSVEDLNEIDKLADVFIANCHEKFRLEKQESYRRFQEMMARSM